MAPTPEVGLRQNQKSPILSSQPLPLMLNALMPAAAHAFVLACGLLNALAAAAGVGKPVAPLPLVVCVR